MMRILRAVILASFLACGATAHAERPVRFVDSAGAKAFQAEDYTTAAAEFERLLETNPGNTLILRYLAMTYDQLGRYADALKTYATALSAAPDNVALLYHSGETLYHAHYADDAIRHFRLVLEYGPDTKYASLARAYLDALQTQWVDHLSPGAPRRFGVLLEFGVQRDEYQVVAAADGGRTRSETTRATESLSLEWYLLRRPDWVVSLNYGGYGSQYLGDDDGRKDLWQHSAGALLQRSGSLGAVPAVASVRGYGQWVRFDGGPAYSESAVGSALMQLGLTRDSSTRFSYRYTDDRFEDDGFDATYSSRDAANHAGGIEHTLYFMDRETWLTFGAEFQMNDAEGSNFVYDGQEYSALLSLPFLAGLRLQLGYEYGELEYTDFAGPVARDTTRNEWNVELSRWLGRSVLARFTYREVNEDSSLSVLSYDRRDYGLSMAYVY